MRFGWLVHDYRPLEFTDVTDATRPDELPSQMESHWNPTAKRAATCGFTGAGVVVVVVGVVVVVVVVVLLLLLLLLLVLLLLPAECS